MRSSRRPRRCSTGSTGTSSWSIPFQAGAGTSHNMNANEVIANRANQILGYALDDPQEAGQPQRSRQHGAEHQRHHPDRHPAGRAVAPGRVAGAVDELADALDQKAREFDDVVKSGRTHLQDAVPVRLGQEFGAYAQAVRYDRERIAAAGDRLRRLGIGGTATGTGLNAHPEYHAPDGGAAARADRDSRCAAAATCSRRCRAWRIRPTSRAACARCASP